MAKRSVASNQGGPNPQKLVTFEAFRAKSCLVGITELNISCENGVANILSQVNVFYYERNIKHNLGCISLILDNN